MYFPATQYTTVATRHIAEITAPAVNPGVWYVKTTSLLPSVREIAIIPLLLMISASLPLTVAVQPLS